MIHFSLYVAEAQTECPASSSALWYPVLLHMEYGMGCWDPCLCGHGVWHTAHGSLGSLHHCVWSVSGSAGICIGLYGACPGALGSLIPVCRTPGSLPMFPMPSSGSCRCAAVP